MWLPPSHPSPSVREVRAGTQGGRVGTLLTGSVFTQPALVQHQDHQPQGGTIHNALGPPTSVIHPDAHRGNLRNRLSKWSIMS